MGDLEEKLVGIDELVDGPLAGEEGFGVDELLVVGQNAIGRLGARHDRMIVGFKTPIHVSHEL